MRKSPPANIIPIDISETVLFTGDLSLSDLSCKRIHHPLPLLIKEGSLNFISSPPAKGEWTKAEGVDT
jgi:hypothetical protein